MRSRVKDTGGKESTGYEQVETLLWEKSKVGGRREQGETIYHKHITKRESGTETLQMRIKRNLDTAVFCSNHGQIIGTSCCTVTKAG